MSPPGNIGSDTNYYFALSLSQLIIEIKTTDKRAIYIETEATFFLFKNRKLQIKSHCAVIGSL